MIRFVRHDPRAVLPTRAHPTDSGLDLTVLAVSKRHPGGVTLYDTGLTVVPDPNMYCDLVARSSLMKLGYMLANGVGIIDNGYRGRIMVALWKFNPDAPDLQLPCRVAQLVPRTVIPTTAVEVDDGGAQTARGQGGFGSTTTQHPSSHPSSHPSAHPSAHPSSRPTPTAHTAAHSQRPTVGTLKKIKEIKCSSRS